MPWLIVLTWISLVLLKIPVPPLLVFSTNKSMLFFISLVKNTNEGGLFCLHHGLSGL